MMQTIKSHLPLIALATVSAVVILYLYRELQKARRELTSESDCADRPAKEAKRVRFEDPPARSTSKGKPQQVDPKATKATPAPTKAAAVQEQPPPAEADASQAGALESDE